MYTVHAGRVISKNDKPLFTIERQVTIVDRKAELTHVQADALTHYICKKLNENPEEWINYYKSYMNEIK